MPKIFVTKTFLPPRQEYEKYIDLMWQSHVLTNQGPLLLEFEKKIKKYLGVEFFHFVNNGTLALQLALRTLDIMDGEVITTPFSYVATTSSILWERCEPVFVDIDPNTFCIDASKIEAAITPETKAILAVHVYGYPCDIEKIESIANKHNIKVIYDGAHAFGVEYRGKSLLSYGDVSTASFHATKPFHTIEGGGLILRERAVSERVELEKRFGHDLDVHVMLGINAKANEFQAAMGLCNLGHVDRITLERKRLSELYDSLLEAEFGRPKLPEHTKYNYAYYPILLKSETELLRKVEALNAQEIYPRRYFFPSLNKLPYIKGTQVCPVAEDISSRVLCLPLYPGLDEKDVKRIAEILKQ